MAPVGLPFQLDPEGAEPVRHAVHQGRDVAAEDGKPAAGDCRRDHAAGQVHIVGSGPKLGARERPARTANGHAVGAFPLHFHAHAPQQAQHVDHVGLAGGIPDGDREAAAGGVECEIEGGGDTRLDQPDVVVVGMGPGRRERHRRVALLHGDIQLAEPVQVRGDAAEAEVAPTRQGHLHAAEARQQWTSERERAAQPPPHGRVDGLRPNLRRIHVHVAFAAGGHLGAETSENLQVGVDIKGVGKVAEQDALAGEGRRGQGTHQRVLVGDGGYLAVQGDAPLDAEGAVHRGLLTPR